MTEPALLSRVESLERSLRRWKLAALAGLVLVCILVVADGSFAEKDGPLVVQELIVRDELGRELRLTGPALRMHNEGGAFMARPGEVSMGGLELYGGTESPHLTLLAGGAQLDLGPGFVAATGKGGSAGISGREDDCGLHVQRGYEGNASVHRFPE